MFIRFLNAIVKRRRFVGWAVLVFFVAGTVYALARGNVYESKTLLLPPVEEGGQGILSAWMAKLNLPAIMTPVSAGMTSAAILGDIIASRHLCEMIVDSLALREHYGSKNLDGAIRKLRAGTKTAVTETGLIRLSVRDRDPEYARRIAEAYIAGLDSLNRFLQRSRADETRTFVARQLETYGGRLQTLRREISAFQGKNNIVDFDEQVRGAIQVAADLKVRSILAGIERDLMSEFTQRDATELRRKAAEHENLNRQLGRLMSGDSAGAVFVPLKRLPALAQQFAAMQRDLEVNERIYSYLLERYEEAGIEQTRTTSVVQIVDAPSLPEEPAGVPLPLVVAIVTALGFVWSAATAGWWEWTISRAKSSSEERAFGELRAVLESDAARLRRALKL
jgi:uncharacterized protein involved in exopolysaccharide biosynthesis